MAYYLPSSANPDGDSPAAQVPADCQAPEMSDLKIFWGPEICRLEYLVHLVETGRIVDECGGVQA